LKIQIRHLIKAWKKDLQPTGRSKREETEGDIEGNQDHSPCRGMQHPWSQGRRTWSQSRGREVERTTSKNGIQKRNGMGYKNGTEQKK